MPRQPASDPLAPPPPPQDEELVRQDPDSGRVEVYRLLLDGKHDDEHHMEEQGEPKADDNNNAVVDTNNNDDDSSVSHAVLLGAVANLCSATLGAGVLSLPYAMAKAGLVAGTLLLAGAALATTASVHILVQACDFYQYFTYESLVQRVLVVDGSSSWTRFLPVLVQVCMVLFCGGCAVAYCIAVGDILQQSNLLWVHGNRALTLLAVWSIAMLPLSLLRSMRALQCSSGIGIASIGTLVFATAVHLLQDCCEQEQHVHPPDDSNSTNSTYSLLLEEQYSDSYLTTTTSRNLLANSTKHRFESVLWPTHGALSILAACPIILFAFSCQVNVCAIYHELPIMAMATNDDNNNNNNNNNGNNNNTNGKLDLMRSVARVAVSICSGLYLSVALIGLADFGPAGIETNLLNNYAPPVGIMQVACGGMAAAVIMAFPLNIFPARVTLQHAWEEWQTWQQQRERERQQQQRLRPHETLTAALLEDAAPVEPAETAEEQEEEPEQPSAETAEETQAAADSGEDEDAAPTVELIEEEDKNEEEDVPSTPVRIRFASPADEENAAAALPAAEDVDNEQQQAGAGQNWNWRQHVLLTLLLAGSAVGLALVVPDISTVFGLLGGTTSSILGFCIPGALGIRLCRDKHAESQDSSSLGTWIVSWCLLLGGILVGIVTTVVTVYTTVVGT